MKRYLTVLFLFIYLTGFSNAKVAKDTLSFWKVYVAGTLIKEGNVFSENSKIILKKGKIRAKDILNVKYFDDTPCIDCNGSILIKTKNEEEIKKIGNLKSNYDFDVKTTDLQVLAFKNKSSILKFYYREDDSQKEILLFQIQIK
ncbi:hypothetical protein [Aquimarina pacifica]|uniref:hypothetical protein n=1 Tax=Aquimarina pacifica TaxID=1296415 RepID=UPI00046E6D47|nr:hypothetical protein [Aquimarina pacifica]